MYKQRVTGKPTKIRTIKRTHKFDEAIAEIQRVIDIEEEDYNNTFPADRYSYQRDITQGLRNSIRILKGAYVEHTYKYGDKYIESVDYIDCKSTPEESGVIWEDDEEESL